LALADVEQTDAAHHLAGVQRDPEVAIAALIAARDVDQVGLRVGRHRQAELALLDRKHQVKHRPSTTGFER
jgi:hypothetical protein